MEGGFGLEQMWWTWENVDTLDVCEVKWTELRKNLDLRYFPALEKEMATHSSVLAWRIPGTGAPGGLQSTSCKVALLWELLGSL